MTEKLTDMSVRAFSEVLSSRAPVPGGGGAAAAAGALAAALCQMAGNLTLGRKKYAAVEPDIRRMLSELDEIREELLNLVEEDAEAFEPLSRAYSIPKDDPERDRKLEEATMEACRPPIGMVRCLSKAVPLFFEMREKGSVMLKSDVACGALLCVSAMECAAVNVLINTKTLKDRDIAQTMEREVREEHLSKLPALRNLAKDIMGI